MNGESLEKDSSKMQTASPEGSRSDTSHRPSVPPGAPVRPSGLDLGRSVSMLAESNKTSMSQQNISLFLGKLSADTEIQRQVATIDAEAKRFIAARLSSLSQEHELPFTPEDLLAEGSSNSGELPDDDLGTVSGGSFSEDFQRTFSGLYNMFPGLDPKRYRK